MADTKWILVNAPVAGLRVDMPSTLLPPENTPACSDVRFINSYIEKAKGAASFANTGTVALDGDVMKLVEFGNDAGSDFLMALTTTKTYELYSGTFTDRSSAAWTGDQDDRFCTVAFNNQLMISNGVDAIREWDTTNANDAGLSGATAFRPNWMSIFGERLCLYGILNTGTNYPRRLRWCIAGDATDWTGTGSGAKDLRTELTSGDEIVRAEPLGNNIFIYGGRSIAVQGYRSDATVPFPTDAMTDEIGLAAPDALVNIAGGEHIILGYDGIYSYKGGKSGTPIDSAIHDDLIKNMNMQYIQRSFMTFAPEHDKIRLFYPRGSATECSHYYELNLRGMTWTRGVRAFTGAGRYKDATNDLYTMYGDTSGVVYEDDEEDINVGSTAVDGQFETPDFLGEEPDETLVNTWHTIYINAKSFVASGDTITVEASVDEGTSFVAMPLRQITLTTAWKWFRLDFEVNSEAVRFRFRNNVAGQSFAVRSYKVGYDPGSEIGAA